MLTTLAALRTALLSFCPVILLVLLLSCSQKQVADSSFDTSVARPAYANAHPRVLFDEAHNNIHTMSGGYKPFVRLISNDGYQVIANKEAFSKQALTGFNVLVIVNALGAKDAPDHSAFTNEECDVIRDWVRAGGSLLLITDHAPTGAAAENLSRHLGVSMSKGMTEDPKNYDSASGDTSQLLFTRENGLLLDHPITQGREAKEKVDLVMTFTGQSLKGPEGGTAFLTLGDSAINRPASTKVEKSGGDIRVTTYYGEGEPARGYSQGVALQFGKGRTVVLGEAAMLTAQLDGKTKKPFGMNVPGVGNRQLALNIMHWLSNAL
jgi:hypothetical protein